MKARCLVVGMMLTASAVTDTKEPLSIHVSPGVAFAPANLVIRTSLEPHAENRSMEVVADSSEFYRSSTIALEGTRAPRTTTLQFRSLPPGNYAVTATVIGINRHLRVVAQTRVNVIGSGLEQ